MRNQTSLDRLEKFLADQRPNPSVSCVKLLPNLQKVAMYMTSNQELLPIHRPTMRILRLLD